MFDIVTVKHAAPLPRLSGMHAPLPLDRPLRPVLVTALRTALALGTAMLLILVLLPLALAAQAASI